ncbi:MAG: SPFH domain-containing protein [Planctomycetes bacterium]|nr:SPFH domain-containing protein [Planctomycetota bacterium]
MSFFERLSGQFLEIIEWVDNTNDTLVYRFPVYAKEIKMGAKLTVREGQAAVFVNEGRIADVYKPGMVTLSTQNMPILSTLMGWKYGFESPFKAEVYYVATRAFTDMKWGTQNPIMMRDPEFGPVRLRSFGTYAMRATDPGALLKNLVGTDGLFQIEEVQNQLRNLVVANVGQFLGAGKTAALDLMGKSAELNQQIERFVNEQLAEWGIQISKLMIENVSFPPEVEAALDQRTKMGVIGDMQKFTQYQTATAIGDAAKNPGGMAGDAMGLGAGVVLGQTMANAMAQGMSNANAANAKQGAAPAEDIPGKLQQLKNLFDQKLITETEFEAKKKEILSRM